MNLNILINKEKLKLYFHTESVADLYAAAGFLNILGIQRKNAVIGFGNEIQETIAKSVLEGCIFCSNRIQLPNWFPVGFSVEGDARLAQRGIVVNYVPYKYCYPTRGFLKDRLAIRRALGIKRSRTIVTASCTTSEEVKTLLQAYQGLRFLEKPLLVLALRKAEARLASFLGRDKIKVYERRQISQTMLSVGQSDVVVLNTMGELCQFYKISNLAIVGHDRNIFEPAILGVPVLYFGEPLNMSDQDKEIAKLFDLIWRKNRMAERLLAKHGGAVRIKGNQFRKQMSEILHNPESMIQGARNAVREFYKSIIPNHRAQTTTILSRGIKLFSPIGR